MPVTKITTITFIFECATEGCDAPIEVQILTKKGAVDRIKAKGWFYNKRGQCHCPRHWPKGNHQRRLEVA